MEPEPEVEPTSLDYAAPSEDAKWPITFPILLAGILDVFLLPVALLSVPTYCISRYQTYYFAIAAVVCALGSFVCGGNRSIALRFVVVIGAPALLLGAWYWSLSHWAGGDDGPGFAWGLNVGGATFFNSLLYFATFVALWAQMLQRNRTP